MEDSRPCFIRRRAVTCSDKPKSCLKNRDYRLFLQTVWYLAIKYAASAGRPAAVVLQPCAVCKTTRFGCF